mgnify:FL=1
MALTGQNGDLFRLGQTPSVLRDAIPAARMAVDDRGRFVAALPPTPSEVITTEDDNRDVI